MLLVCGGSLISNKAIFRSREILHTIWAVLILALGAVWLLIFLGALLVWEGRVSAFALVGLLQLAWWALAFFSSTVVHLAAELAIWGLWVGVGGHGGNAGDDGEANGEEIIDLHDGGVWKTRRSVERKL